MQEATLPQRIASNVRVEIARQNLKDKEVAERIGMNAGLLGKRLRGEVPFSTPEIVLVAEALGVPEAVLLTGDTSPLGQRAGNGQQPPVSGTVPPELPSRRERVDGLAAEGQVAAS